jgi:hypothetical protein
MNVLVRAVASDVRRVSGAAAPTRGRRSRTPVVPVLPIAHPERYAELTVDAIGRVAARAVAGAN